MQNDSEKNKKKTYKLNPMDLVNPQTPQQKLLRAMVNFIYDDDAIDGMQALHHLLVVHLPHHEQVALRGVLNILTEVARVQALPREKRSFPV